MATTWNPADNTGFTLSNGNLTAGNTQLVDAIYARATGPAKSSGKLYFEITCVGSTTCGVASPTGSASYGNYANVLYLGNTTGYCYGSGGTTYDPSWYNQTGNGTYGFAVDLDAKTIKVRKGTGAWSTTKSIAHLASVLPALSYNAVESYFTLNCGDSAFVGAIPDGYSAWDSSVAVTDDQSVI